MLMNKVQQITSNSIVLKPFDVAGGNPPQPTFKPIQLVETSRFETSSNFDERFTVHVPTQLILHLAAVSASCWITPSHNSPRFTNGSKSTSSCSDVLDLPQLLLHPRSQQPQIQAKAPPVAWMCWTFLSCSCTWLLSPPAAGSPQVTAAPDSRMAAKAPPVAWTC